MLGSSPAGSTQSTSPNLEMPFPYNLARPTSLSNRVLSLPRWLALVQPYQFVHYLPYYPPRSGSELVFSRPECSFLDTRAPQTPQTSLELVLFQEIHRCGSGLAMLRMYFISKVSPLVGLPKGICLTPPRPAPRSQSDKQRHRSYLRTQASSKLCSQPHFLFNVRSTGTEV